MSEPMPPTILELAEQIADGCAELFDRPFAFLEKNNVICAIVQSDNLVIIDS